MQIFRSLNSLSTYLTCMYDSYLLLWREWASNESLLDEDWVDEAYFMVCWGYLKSGYSIYFLGLFNCCPRFLN